MLVEERVDGPVNEPTSEAPRPPGRPYWPFAMLIAGLLVAVLGAALLLDQRYRAPVGVDRPVATATTPSTPTPASAAPTVAPAPIQPTVAAAAAPASAAPTPTVVVLLPAGLVVDPQLQREIVDAYLRYWDVRKRAYLELDAASLAQVMADPELARELEQLSDLRQQGRAGRVDVEHRLLMLQQASTADALIYDEYLNRSVFLDAVTKRELHSDVVPSLWKVSFRLRRLDGVWKVVDGTQHE